MERGLHLMHAARLVLRLIGLIVVLTLGGYNSASTPKVAKVHVSHAANVRRGAPLNTPSTALPKRVAAAAANPIRLVIPAIEVNAFVEPLGIQSNGDLA